MPDNKDRTQEAISERDALIEETLEKMRRKLQQEFPQDNATLDEIEEAVSRVGEDVLGDLEQRLVDKRTRKHGRENLSACACGRSARYKEMQKRTLVSVHGLVSVVRPYYYCSFCKKGFAPDDVTLGLDRGSTSTRVRTWVAELAAKEAFEEAAQTLLHLRGISLSAATIERIAVSVGKQMQTLQQKQVQDYQAERLPEPKGRHASRLYASMDGVMVPLREPWKKDASQGELQCRFGECKTGIVYEAYATEKGDERLRTQAYVATLGDVQAFGPKIATLAHQNGRGFAKERVVMGDGAPWIWQLAGKYFPGDLQIVDFFHVCEHLSSVADAMYGAGTAQSRVWQKARQGELRQDRVKDVLRAMAAWKPKSAEMHRLRRREFRYFRSNAERMRYGTFLSKGYHIGTGVIESACKHVVALRLDQAGMHWREESAEAIVTIRAALRSTYPPDLSRFTAMAA